MSVPKSANHLPPPETNPPEPTGPRKKWDIIGVLRDLIRNLSA
jgi:hypothetical protein